MFPLDYRRYKGPMKKFCIGFKNQPKFWETAKEAIIATANCDTGKKNIIICNILSSDNGIYTEMQWDYYPTYVVSLL